MSSVKVNGELFYFTDREVTLDTFVTDVADVKHVFQPIQQTYLRVYADVCYYSYWSLVID